MECLKTNAQSKQTRDVCRFIEQSADAQGGVLYIHQQWSHLVSAAAVPYGAALFQFGASHYLYRTTFFSTWLILDFFKADNQ